MSWFEKIASWFNKKPAVPTPSPLPKHQPEDAPEEDIHKDALEEVAEGELTEEEQQALQIKNFIRSDDISNHQLAAMFMQSLYMDWDEDLLELIGQSAEKLTFWAGQDFPEVIRYYKKLVIKPRFFAQYNEIAEFAKALPNFTEIEELRWEAGPYWNQHPILAAASKLPKLKRLYAEGCKMHYLPEELCESEVLEELYLSKNKLHELPESMESMFSLKVLDLSNNQFQRCSRNISKLRKLEVLRLHENPLTDIEPRILGRLYKLSDLQLPKDLAQFYLDTLKEWLPDVDFNKSYWKFD